MIILPQTFNMIAITIIVIAETVLMGVSSLPEHDKISTLPGQPHVEFEQYSGYIAADEKQERNLFYYFVQAQQNPSSKPLVLWLAGGPGCSSLGYGAFMQHGPFKLGFNNVLLINNFSWNKEANMLYVETPAGVGFSYSTNTSFYSFVNDEITARDNLVFLQRWFTEFSEYSNNEFYIAGESYAGHYAPQLAQLIVQNTKFNLKGIMIGSPLLEFISNANSQSEFLWSHGLISDSTYEALTTVCNYSTIFRQQYIIGNLSAVCAEVNKILDSEVGNYIDTNDVTLDVCVSSENRQADALNKQIDVCVGDKVIAFFNNRKVQEAMHAKLVGATQWANCSEGVKFDYGNFEIPIIPILKSLIKSGIRVVVYNGDQDSVVTLTSSRSLVNGLAKEIGLNTTVAYRAWFEEKQVAGWTQVYGDMLSFATIRGGSHQVAYSQPERSLVLFKSFLEGKPLPSFT